MYIFQLMDHSKAGTKSASRQFQIQLDVVASETALARTLDGKISAGYVQLVGPTVVEKEHTKR